MHLEALIRAHLFELALAGSVLVHAGAVTVLPKSSRAKPSASVSVQLVTLARAPRPAAPEPPAPEPEPEAPKPTPAKLPQKPAPAAHTAEPASPPSAPPPAELSGRTLTSEGSGASFAAPAGNDSARTEPIQGGAEPARIPARGPVASAPPARPATPPPPATVSLQDLARRPEPPALAGLLARHYPEDARRRGVGGQAVVRARVDADGRVRSAAVASESDSGFGAACQRTLVGSKWSPPLDREGRPVATWVRYTCRFRVGL